jgi:hypothetical protein
LLKTSPMRRIWAPTPRSLFFEVLMAAVEVFSVDNKKALALGEGLLLRLCCSDLGHQFATGKAS